MVECSVSYFPEIKKYFNPIVQKAQNRRRRQLPSLEIDAIQIQCNNSL